MKKTRKKVLAYAAIDIGSNAVRLLIKQIDEKSANKFSKLCMLRVPLRLGFDVFATNKISREKERRMLRLMKAYRLLMKVYEVDDYRACATSAMRDASNGKEIIAKIEKSTGIRIEIIDGQEEARIIYNNHIEYMGDRHGNYMYVDVGGGSTEVNFLSGGKLLFSHSYNIGTVRMLNHAVREIQWEDLQRDMEKLSKKYPDISIIGSGGNINKLYRLARVKDREALAMPVSELKRLYNELKDMSLQERMDAFELKADRADVIVPASEIFLAISSFVKADTIYVPVIGLADGIIDGLYAKNRLVRPKNQTEKN